MVCAIDDKPIEFDIEEIKYIKYKENSKFVILWEIIFL